MNANIATYPFNASGKMTRQEYLSHMKQVWKRMGMIKSVEQVVVKRPAIKQQVVEQTIQQIEAAKASFPAPISIEASPQCVERRRIKSIVSKPNRINGVVGKPRQLVIGAMPQKPHLRDIVRVVSDYYGTTPVDIMSESHKADIVAARHACFFIYRKLTGRSFLAIGRDFKRDHSTIVSAVNRMEKRIASDPEFNEAINVITQAVIDTSLLKTDVAFSYWGA